MKTRLYRKPQKRNITCEVASSMKKNTIKNGFSDAKKISSGEEEAKHSRAMLENVYRCNGYRYSDLNEESSSSGNSISVNKPGILCLDEVFSKIRNFIRKFKLNLSDILSWQKVMQGIFIPVHMTIRNV